MAGIEIVAVKGGSELKDFIDLPWRIYAEYPNGSPLKKEVRRMLDPTDTLSGSFRGRPLSSPTRFGGGGRIAGIIDRHYNQFHNEKMGIWDSSNVLSIRRPRSPLLFRGDVVSPKRMTFMRGPLSPSSNYEVACSLRIITRPHWMMAYNPPYYPRLVESCGFTKERTCWLS